MNMIQGFMLSCVLATQCNAAIVFSDSFTRPDNTDVGNSWTEVSTGGGDAAISGGILNISNGSTAGRTYLYQDTGAFANFSPQLDANTGMVVWSFNVRANRSELGGFNSGNYGIAFVLATSSQNFLTGTGYAVVWGQSGSPDPVRLVRYTTGLSLNSGITDLITGTEEGSPFSNMAQERLSVQVSYSPADHTWGLFARNDGASFSDPASGTMTSLGTATDNTYTGASLRYMGPLWNYSTASGQIASFDNVQLLVTPEPAVWGAISAGFLGGIAALRRFRSKQQTATTVE